MSQIKINVPDTVEIENTALAAHRAAGRTFRGIVGGARVAALPKSAGTYLRACVGGARRDAVATLDAVTGRPSGPKATRADRIAWYLAAPEDAPAAPNEPGE